MEITSYLLGKKAGGGGDTPTGTINITENGTTNVSSYATANVNVQPKLEEKSITITENGTTTLTPTTGKDGMSSVSITTNVSGGGSGINWTQIGYSEQPQVFTDDFNYSKSIYDNWDETQTSLIEKFYQDYNLVYMPLVDTSNATDTTKMFYNCNYLRNLPLLDFSSSESGKEMFKNCQCLKTIPLLNCSNMITTQNMFDTCSQLETISQLNISKSVNAKAMFMQCKKLANVPILNIEKVGSNFTNMFADCTSLTDTSLDNILQSLLTIASPGSDKTLVRAGVASTNYPASRIQALPHYQDFIDAGWTIS